MATTNRGTIRFHFYFGCAVNKGNASTTIAAYVQPITLPAAALSMTYYLDDDDGALIGIANTSFSNR